jgi:hypothetical protein
MGGSLEQQYFEAENLGAAKTIELESQIVIKNS